MIGALTTWHEATSDTMSGPRDAELKRTAQNS